MLAQDVEYFAGRSLSGNYKALLAAIVGEINIDTALREVANIHLKSEGHAGKAPNRYTEEDYIRMVDLRMRGNSYQHIGDIYNTSGDSIARIVNREKRKGRHAK